MINTKAWFAQFMKVFGYFMVAVYIALGVMLLAADVYNNIPKNLKITFALFFIAYGFYRLVKMLTANKMSND